MGNKAGRCPPFFASYELHFFPGYAYLFLTSRQLINDYPAMLWLSSFGLVLISLFDFLSVLARHLSKPAATVFPIYGACFLPKRVLWFGSGLEK